MAEVSAEQVRWLLLAAEASRRTRSAAQQARDTLDRVLLDVARKARVGVAELSAITGMHPNAVRAAIQRAAGPTSIDFEQPELNLAALGVSPASGSDGGPTGVVPMPPGQLGRPHVSPQPGVWPAAAG